MPTPRPTRPRSWCSWETPNRSASMTTMAVALATSTPTSMTVVATSTSTSPAANRRITSSLSSGGIRPCSTSTRSPASGPSAQHRRDVEHGDAGRPAPAPSPSVAGVGRTSSPVVGAGRRLATPSVHRCAGTRRTPGGPRRPPRGPAPRPARGSAASRRRHDVRSRSATGRPAARSASRRPGRRRPSSRPCAGSAWRS